MELLDISIALGDNKTPVASLFDDKRLIGKTGIEHVYNSTGSTQELALRATAALTSYDKSKIGMSILVTQTPDDFLPSGAIGISDCLGLPQNILSFDINQGCSGFVQALVLVNSLVAALRGLLSGYLTLLMQFLAMAHQHLYGAPAVIRKSYLKSI